MANYGPGVGFMRDICAGASWLALIKLAPDLFLSNKHERPYLGCECLHHLLSGTVVQTGKTGYL